MSPYSIYGALHLMGPGKKKKEVHYIGNTVPVPTGHTLVEATLFPHHFNEITLNQRGIDIELTSVPSGLVCSPCLSLAYHKQQLLSHSEITMQVDFHGDRGIMKH